MILAVAAALFGWAAYVLMDGHIFWKPVDTSAPATFPYVLETRLIPTQGDKRWIRLEVYEHTIQILGGRPATILALIRIQDVIDVAIQNRSADGLPVAGLSLTTTQGQFMFFSEGFNAPNKMKRTANVIRSLSPGVQVRDLDATRLTPDNVAHNV